MTAIPPKITVVPCFLNLSAISKALFSWHVSKTEIATMSQEELKFIGWTFSSIKSTSTH